MTDEIKWTKTFKTDSDWQDIKEIGLFTGGEITGTCEVEFWERVLLELPPDTRTGYLVYDEQGIHEDETV